MKGKAAPEKSPEVGRHSKPRSDPASESAPPMLPPWRPRIETIPGKPLNVGDRVGASSLVVVALSKSCALPLDMERHAKHDDEFLLIQALQASLLVSILQVILPSLGNAICF